MRPQKHNANCFFNLRRQKQRLGWQTEAEVLAVAKDLQVSPQDVRSMEMRLASYDESFDLPIGVHAEETSNAPVNYLEHKGINPETQLAVIDVKNRQREALQQALAQLDQRSQDIVTQRWLIEKKVTLQALAEQYNISIERIRQLEKAALKKVKACLVNS